jgi:hypothetical protein
MGTRSITKVIETWNDEKTSKLKKQTLVCMYRQMDGYPSGMGSDLAEFLNSGKIVNGISLAETERVFNGMGCLSAQMVAHFKDGAGGIYLYPTNVGKVWQEYEYEIIQHEGEELKLKVIEVGYINDKGKYCKGKKTLYFGSPKGFESWLSVKETIEG